MPAVIQVIQVVQVVQVVRLAKRASHAILKTVPVVLTALASLGTLSCTAPERPDAYGNVEAVDVVVGAEATGRLVSFSPREGQKLEAQAVVGTIEATDLRLQRDQLTAERAATLSRSDEIARQGDVLESQRRAAGAERDAARAQRAALDAQQEIARRTLDRAQRLLAEKAGTQRDLDAAERDTRVLEQQIRAQDDQIRALDDRMQAQTHQVEATRDQRQTVSRQVATIDARIAQVDERIRKSQIENPVAGTVLATYAEQGELVQAGQPVYKIANLDAVDVRAYITETQLGQVKVGSPAQVTVDVSAQGRQSISGTVSWVSSEAEFTPTPIQTREERADLVYAIKIRVPNEAGVLKVGMPADVQFTAASPAR